MGEFRLLASRFILPFFFISQETKGDLFYVPEETREGGVMAGLTELFYGYSSSTKKLGAQNLEAQKRAINAIETRLKPLQDYCSSFNKKKLSSGASVHCR